MFVNELLNLQLAIKFFIPHTHNSMTQLQIAVVIAITYPWENEYSAIATQLKFQFAHTALILLAMQCIMS